MRALALAAVVAVAAAVAGCGEDGPAGLRAGAGGVLRPASTRTTPASGWSTSGWSARAARRSSSKELNGPQNAVTALLRGDIEVASLAHHTAIAAVAEGADIKLVLMGLRVPQWQLIARPGIDSPRELQGKKIAVFGLKTNTQRPCRDRA